MCKKSNFNFHLYQKEFVHLIIFFTLIINLQASEGEVKSKKNSIFLSSSSPTTLYNQKNFKNTSGPGLNLTSEINSFQFSLYVINDEFVIDEIYFKKKFNNFSFMFGKLIDDFSLISSKLSSGSMFESGNSFGIPRYKIDYLISKGAWTLNTSLSDGILDTNFINEEKPYIHKKSLHVSYHDLSVGLVHGVIWGGKVIGFEKQPSGLDDYIKVFFNQGGGSDALITDQGNRLGDAFGIWTFGFKKKIHHMKFNFYHEFYFEDNSGLKLKNKMNQFDGLSGISLKNEKTEMVIERIKTTHQGGKVHPPGRDGYYWNGIYRNGWKYKDRVIGNIFLQPYNNRVKINHFGITHQFDKTSIMFFHSKGKIYNISYNGSIPNEYEENFLLTDYEKFKETSLSYIVTMSNVRIQVTAENSLNQKNNFFLNVGYYF